MVLVEHSRRTSDKFSTEEIPFYFAGHDQMSEQGGQTQDEWIMFRDRVAEAVGIARAAVTNVVAALASITVAVVGAAVTLATADYKSDSVAAAMLFAIAGAGVAALVIVLGLTVEAVLATRAAERWRDLYADLSRQARAGKSVIIPWNDLDDAHVSIGIHWKVSLPVGLFLIGLICAGIAAFNADRHKSPADHAAPTGGTAVPHGG
jgi:hypothetical protein